MAEVLGLISSIGAVIQLAGQVASLSWGYVGKVKGAPKNIRELAGEISGLSQVLDVILDRVEKSSERTVFVLLNTPLQTLTAELDKILAKLVQRDGFGKLIDSLKWPLKESEMLQYMSQIERHKTLLSLALTADNNTLSDAIHKHTQETLDAVKRMEESVRDTNLAFQVESTVQSTQRQQEELLRNEAKRKRVLDWVYSTDYDTRHIEINNILQKDTGRWLLEDTNVLSWARGDGRRLILGRGHPGSGKTYLSAVVINHFQSRAQAEGHGVAYIYFNYKEQESQQPAHVLRSLIRQLADKISFLPTKLSELCNKEEKNKTKPTNEELYVALLEISRLFPRVFFVFDALDECHRDNQRRELLPLFRRMEKDGICVFLTSRPHPEDVHDAFDDMVKIRLFARDEDIATYITEKIKMNPRARKLTQDEKAKIISSLTEYAKGMFLLVRFHVEYLCQQTSEGNILKALASLKDSSQTRDDALNSAYKRAVDNISSQNKSSNELAIKIISWLLKARRTLTVEELRIAVSVGPECHKLEERDLPGNETLIDVCHGLVTIDKDTIRLAHHTVLEYLQRHPLIPVNEFDLARTCVTYLSFDTLSGGTCTSAEAMKDRLTLHPFFDYAASQLESHLKECDEESSTEMYLGFIKNLGGISSWLQFLSYKSGSSPDIYLTQSSRLPLHLASSLGHLPVVRLLVEDGADISSQDDNGDTALHDAASGGHEAVVKLLLDGATSANIATQNKDGLTALHRAAKAAQWITKGDHKAVVELLLNKGADISSKDNRGETALHHAAAGGHEMIVTSLLEKGADASIQTTRGLTALHYAATRGHKEVAQLLLGKGMDILSRDSDGNTALHHAALGGHEAVVRLLLEKETDIMARSNDRATALHRAATRGHGAVVKLLLDNGADNSVRNSNGDTALHCAAHGGHEVVIRLLLDMVTPADTTAQNKDKATALHHAAKGGHEVVVRLLLEKMTPTAIATRDSFSCTALHRAAEGGHEGVLRLLLIKGQDIKSQKNDGNTPLHDAARKGHETVFELLLENATPADIAIQNNYEFTALHEAAKGGNETMLKLLLDKGIDTGVQDKYGRTALHDAARKGHETAVSLLLDVMTPASLGTRDNFGYTELHWAVKERHEGVVRRLLGKGAKVSSEKNDGITPLDSAISSGDETMVGLLLDRMTPTEIAAETNRYTVLHSAVNGGNEAIVGLLLDRMTPTEIATRDNEGHTPLYNAVSSENEAMVGLLLDRMTPAEIVTQNNSGFTALHKATKAGNRVILELLLSRGASIAVQDNYGETALHDAARLTSSSEVARLLIDKATPVEIAIRNRSGSTALHLAVQEQNEAMLRLLLEKGAHPTNQTNNGDTPLHHAVRAENKVICEMLLSNSMPADIGTRNHSGNTTLHQAVETGNETIVKLLLNNSTPAKITARNETGETALHQAAKAGYEVIVKLLLGKGANIDASDDHENTALQWAAWKGYEAVVKLLLDEGADIEHQDKDGDTALLSAAQKGYAGIVDLILDSSTPAVVTARNKTGETALHRAAKAGYEVIVKLLLGKGANIDTPDGHGNTALQLAVWGEYEAVVKLLLDEGADRDIELQDKDGDTALLSAAQKGYASIFSLLLDSSTPANIAARDKTCETALYQAAKAGYEVIVKLLLDKGANIDASDGHENTALHGAAWCGHEAVVKLLLDEGADIELQDGDGDTALHCAAHRGYTNIVGLLLDKGANFSILNNDQMTPLIKADNAGHDRIVELLREEERSHTQGNNAETSLSSSLSEDAVPPILEKVAVVEIATEADAQETLQKQPEPLSIIKLGPASSSSTSPVQHLPGISAGLEQQEDEKSGGIIETKDYLKLDPRVWEEFQQETVVWALLIGVLGVFTCFLYSYFIYGLHTFGGLLSYLWDKWAMGVMAWVFLMGFLGLCVYFGGFHSFEELVYILGEG